jgi:3-isopropylmalate dehydrogenase
MMLRESFGLDAAAAWIEEALAETWQQGWRTADIAESGGSVLGTRAMGDRVVKQVLLRAEVGQPA